jgi:hypothetical protein
MGCNIEQNSTTMDKIVKLAGIRRVMFRTLPSSTVLALPNLTIEQLSFGCLKDSEGPSANNPERTSSSSMSELPKSLNSSLFCLVWRAL